MATKKTHPITIKKREPVKAVAPNPELEKKRKEFQAAVSGAKKPAAKKAHTKPKHHTPRKRTIIIIVAALLAVIGTTAVSYGYYFWQQSPEKMVSDALINASSAESASFDVDVNSPTRMLASMRGEYTDGRGHLEARVKTSLPGELNEVTVSAVAANTDLYVRAPQVSSLVNEVVPTEQRVLASAIMPMVKDKVDDKWLYVRATDANYLKGVTGVSSCVVEATQRIMTSPEARTALTDVYMSNRFFAISEIRTDKNFGTYELTIDQAKFNQFLDAVASAESSTPFSRCTLELNALRTDSVYESVVYLVIDKSSRTINQVVLNTSGLSRVTVMITPQFNSDVTIDMPADPVRFDDVKSQIFSLFAS